MDKRIAILALISLALAACSSAPQHQVEIRDTPAPVESRTVGKGGYLPGDGPGTDVPANLDKIPDAEPKSEPPHRYANRPYMALGKTYTPITATDKFREHGIASWYGKKFHGQKTSSGEVYDMYAMTAAHPTLPIPSYARVTNTANKKSVVVRINDRGPFLHDRVIDLSYTAAYKLGIIDNGSSAVTIESVTADTGINIIARTDTVESRPLEKAEPVSSNNTPLASTVKTVASNIYLQLGAFKSQEAAESFMAKISAALGSFGKHVGIFQKDGLMRVHVGPYASQDEARSSADSLKEKLGFKPLLNLH